MPSRTANTLKNAQMGALCYFASLLVSFFSRKIFLEHLGTEFLGFTGTLASILGFLNISEFGISSAISIVLYKPLFDQNQQAIAQITSVLGYLYRCVGLFILMAGGITAIVLPFIYQDFPFSHTLLYVGFFSYLFSSLLGYFINYGTVLLSADQRNYVVSGYFQLVYSAKVIFQCFFAVWTEDFFMFFLIEILFSILYSIILNLKLRKVYPWLQTSVTEGKKLLFHYPEIRNKLGQTVIHSIGGFVQNQSTPLFIMNFVSLPMVAIYTNYTLVCGSIKLLMHQILASSTSSIGNLIAEGDKEKIYSLYKELLSLRFACTGIVSVCVYYLIPEFINLWVGQLFVLPQSITILISLLLFLSLLRETTDHFLTGYGLIQDIWSPIVESVIFVIGSIFGGYFWGLSGILIGSILSLILVIFLWKPYFLFSKGFALPIGKYVIFFIFHLALLFISFLLTKALLSVILPFINSVSSTPLVYWVIKSFILFSIQLITVFLLFFVFSQSFRFLIIRLCSLIKT